MAVSFDLFDTLVRVDAPRNPSAAVARELRERKVAVPEDFAAAYREPHIDAPDGAEIPLPMHVAAALDSCGIEASKDAIRRAVVAAFDPAVERRPGATEAIDSARDHGPVGVLSNCSVPELARRSLIRADLDGAFDAVVTSAGCGWRKPDPRAFEAIAGRLDAGVADLIHVGDDPSTDGGATEAGARAVLLADTGLGELPRELEELA